MDFDREHFLTFCSKLTIPSKEGGEDEEGGHTQLVPLIPLATQRYFLDQFQIGWKKKIRFFVILKCLAPHTRVLTADLRWVQIGDIEPGDKLVGFDELVQEEHGRRKLREAAVIDKWTTKQWAWKIIFASGLEIICSAHHKFLCQKRGGVDYRWWPIMKMRVGDKIRCVSKPWGDPSYEDGWAAGIIDGEGSVHCKPDQGARVSVYQRSGSVMERYREYLHSRDIPFYTAVDDREGFSGNEGKQGNVPVELTAVGRIGGALKLIGLSRPTRFISTSWWEGKSLPKDMEGYGHETIVKIETMGETDLVDIETTTGTFIAEGLCSHNCRQSGLTTLGLAMDLYWAFKVKGLVHNFIGDTAKVTHYNRSLCRRFVHSLQKYPEWRYEIVDDNEDLMSFSNDSMINWHVANVRRGGGLGRSIGASAAHGTEVGGWEDEDGADSLMSSLAETSPNRIFLWEGTASGPGFFQDMCKGAAKGTESTEKFIFIGWWLHPWYRMYPERFEEHRQIYQVYWESNPVYSREEAFWVDIVRRRYGCQIEPEQMAWWRWHLKQRKRGNLDMMYQEYPPIPEKAWQYGARSFFASNRLIERETIILETRDEQKDYFRLMLKMGRDTTQFNDSDLVRVDPKTSFWDCCMWDPPQPAHDLYRTVIGVDPIHGVDEQSNDAAVEVFICYTDCYVQAAEFTANGIPAFQLAWVVLHLAAMYGGNPMLCTELQGGGFELQNEIRRLQNGLAWGYSKVLEDAFSGLQHYRWTPLDRRNPVSGESYHYKTTRESKEMMLEALKHYFERNMCLVRSPRLLKQMASCSWTKDGALDVPRPSDLVMAAGFATMAYKQVLDTDIGGTNHTRAQHEKNLRESRGQTREEFMANMLQAWADKRTLQVRQEELEMQELQESRENLAEQNRGWTRLNR